MPFFSSPSNSPMRWRLPWRKYLVLANFWISPYICAFDHGWKNQSDWQRPANVSRQGDWGKQKKHKNKVDNDKSLIYRRMKNGWVAGPCTCCISLRKRASWLKHLESEPLPRGHSNEALDTQTALLVSYWHIAVFSGPVEILSQTCSSKESWIILQQPRPDFDVTAVSRPWPQGLCRNTLTCPYHSGITPGPPSGDCCILLLSLLLSLQVAFTPICAPGWAGAVDSDFWGYVFRESCCLSKTASTPSFSKALYGWLVSLPLVFFLPYSQTHCLKNLTTNILVHTMSLFVNLPWLSVICRCQTESPGHGILMI